MLVIFSISEKEVWHQQRISLYLIDWNQSINQNSAERYSESGETYVKASPSPANADEQGIVKGEGSFLEYDYFSIPA